MVQYVFTPWRDRHELLLVRRQFYTSLAADSGGSGPRSRTQSHAPWRREGGPAGEGASRGAQGTRPTASRRQAQQHLAVARVSMWMQRGGCPHMVESTALLTAAVLSDEDRDAGAGEDSTGTSAAAAAAATYAVRAAYSAAFSRFVTGLLDGHQDKQRKQSMYSIAKTIGLPATFVELRHQSTHEQLPSLAKLRSAAKNALEWIWDYYWKHLGDDTSVNPTDPCAEAVLRYLREEDDARRRRVMGELTQWDRDRLLETVAELQDSLPGNQVFLKCVKLKAELVSADAGAPYRDADQEVSKKDQESQEELSQSAEELKAEEHRSVHAPAVSGPARDLDSGPDTGWSRYAGTWKPKPIGIV